MRPNKGDQFICINADGWYNDGRWARVKKKLFGIDNSADGPDKDDIVTLRGIEFENGNRYYLFEEWPEDYDGYIADEFVPIISDSVLEEALKEISEPVATPEAVRELYDDFIKALRSSYNID
jgi:hypothetical protein